MAASNLDLFEDEYEDDYYYDDEPEPKRKRSVFAWIIVIVLLAGIGFAVWLGMREVLGIGSYQDYDGTGTQDVVYEVKSGSSISQIGADLASYGVVASAQAFTAAGKNDAAMQTIHPGYYVLKERMSGASAVAALTAKDSRVGNLQIKPGAIMDDVKQPTGEITSGIFSLLSKASCATLNGKSTCVSVDDLKKAAQSASLTDLGVPSWAQSDVAKAQAAHRLEGLMASGVYEVKPGSDATALLSMVISASAQMYQAEGFPDIAKSSGYSAYQVLTIASLVEKEAVSNDFGKIARVTYNRLSIGMRLQYDSTINYVLDRPQLLTTSTDRDKAGGYNTYGNKGLPPTPISSPSNDAILVAANPPAGNWLYFVKCQKNGLSCFATTLAEHQANKLLAQKNGAY
jgi:UPF0755 protein